MDVLNDPSHRQWYQIGQEFESLIPDYVMSASLLEKSAADNYDDHEFADNVRRLFPLTSKADTWLSAAYFAKNASEGNYDCSPDYHTYVKDRIKTAARIWDIKQDVDTILNTILEPKAIKTAEAEDYCYVNGSTKKYLANSKDSVKLASDYFTRNRHNYPTKMRRTIAKELVKRAEKFDVSIDDSVRREAGLGIPRRDTLMSELLDRSRLVKDAELSLSLANIVELVANSDFNDIVDNLEKIAETIENIDQASGFHKDYGRKILHPSDFLFAINYKEAQDYANDTVKLNKYAFSLEKLAKLDTDIFKTALGSDFVDRITDNGKLNIEKFANELNSMILPDRNELELAIIDSFGA